MAGDALTQHYLGRPQRWHWCCLLRSRHRCGVLLLLQLKAVGDAVMAGAAETAASRRRRRRGQLETALAAAALAVEAVGRWPFVFKVAALLQCLFVPVASLS